MNANLNQILQLEGVLAVWKPAGMTSHDVVAKARRLIGMKRIGHTGTLDPAVTGVLPLCLGRATRFVEYLQELPKTYEAVLRFGVSTDTEDATGSIIEEKDASHLTEAQMKEAVLSFVGDIEQVPPMVSAVKVGGKRLYELAREGLTVERQSRTVTIHSIDWLGASGVGTTRPEIRFAVRCSKGTYIRTLCVDIGRKLSIPAVMAELVRTESAGLHREDSVTFEQIADLKEQGKLADQVLVADKLLMHIPAVIAAYPESEHALQGKILPLERLRQQGQEERELGVLRRLYREDGVFLGLFSEDDTRTTLRPVKVFHPDAGE